MNVLLAGGAGYIGSHTCVELLKAGHSAVIADNFSNSCPEAVKRVEEITGAKIPLYEADVCDKVAVETIFAENKIDAVIHFAGLKAVGESVEKPLLYYRNNIDATLTLLEVMEKFGVNNFIFSSSAVRSPMRTLCLRRMYFTTDSSNLSPATLMEADSTTPPKEITATSAVPPPMSTTI